MKSVAKSVKLSQIVFDPEIYPRKEHDPSLVQKYASCLEEIEAAGHKLSIAEDMTLLDGRHRHLAYLKNSDGDDPDVPVNVYPATKESDKFAIAVRLNSTYGYQLTTGDKCAAVQRLYRAYAYPLERIAQLVSARKEKVLEWTKNIREDEERRQNEKIFDMWLACYTQQEIGKAVELDRTIVTRKIEELCKTFPGTKRTKLSKYEEDDWKPELYDIWSFAKNKNETEVFGNTPAEIVDNLLYTFTEPFDVVVDPFGGGGSTIDVCKTRLRRYWVSDRKPIEERPDIRQHDVIAHGIPGPARWADVALVYLDPPYWKQAAGKYSRDETDLGNIPLVENFNKALIKVIHQYGAKVRPGTYIACITSPTQWPNEDKSVNYHDIDLARGVKNKLKLVRRVVCPYSTQQYNGTQVEIAKKRKLWMVLSRTLLVWQKENDRKNKV